MNKLNGGLLISYEAETNWNIHVFFVIIPLIALFVLKFMEVLRQVRVVPLIIARENEELGVWMNLLQ